MDLDKDLTSLLDSLTWEERAAADSGLSVEEMQKRWNRTKYMREVFNSDEPGDSGELFNDSCS